MYQTPGRKRIGTGTTNNTNNKNTNSNSPSTTSTSNNIINDGPIIDFCTFIQDTPNDEWQKRITKFEELINCIPESGILYLHHPAWYNTPKLLLHLSIPIQELIKDPRSTVVRRVCQSLILLFNRCQSDARLLFKDIMYTILHVQGQTVQTIRNAVMNMIIQIIPEVPCKSVMPIWIERLKDKSPTIRDACCIYLGIAIQSWTEHNYLTDDIYNQITIALIKTLRDPSPTVRQHTKSNLIYIQNLLPDKWESYITDSNSPANSDPKLLQWLRNLANRNNNSNTNDDYDAVEDLSVASRYTYYSESRPTSNNNVTTKPSSSTSIATSSNPIRISSPRLMKVYATTTNTNNNIDDLSVGNGRNNNTTLIQRSIPPNSNNNTHHTVPFSIAVTKTIVPSTSTTSKSKSISSTTNTSNNRSLLIVPPDPPATTTTTNLASNTNKSTTPFSHLMNSPIPSSQSTSTTSNVILGTPPRPKYNTTNNNNISIKSPIPTTPQGQTYSALALQASQEEYDDETDHTEIFDYSDSNHNNTNNNDDTQYVVESYITGSNNTTTTSSSPFIASMYELKKHASKRRSRNSILLQERFRLSNTNNTSTTTKSSNTNLTPTSSHDSSSTNTNTLNTNNHNEQGTTISTTTHNSEIENQQSNGNHIITTSNSNSNTSDKQIKDSPKVDNVTTTSSKTLVSSSSPSSSSVPEHILIAIRLLRAHKSHVDQIMETLKLEMDTLRDFDKLLELSGHPTVDELITYYESIDLCVQQRYNANVTLRNEMNHISTGN